MAQTLTIASLVQDSLAKTRTLILPSLPFAAGFCLLYGAFAWVSGVLPDDGTGTLIFLALFLGLLFAHSVFSVSMYHAVVPARAGLVGSAWKLTLAWLLMAVIAAIGASMIVLFFAVIGPSLGVGTSDDVGNISDMTAQMRENGTFGPIFAIFLAVLAGVFWFAIRMVLFAVATAARGTIHVLRTWSWTKGYAVTLAPAVFALIIVPLVALLYVSSAVTHPLFGPDPSPLFTGVSAVITMLILLPSAWLGHGLAASIYAHIAPGEMDQTMTPASNSD
ncbi:MAG: hypothetical protein AAFV37_07655 [Pseudomonadota bacterium]